MTKTAVAAHFKGRAPLVREIYDRLIGAAEQFGPVKQDPKKTSIHLARRTAFAGVATRKDALILTLKSASDIRSPRIIKREQASANRCGPSRETRGQGVARLWVVVGQFAGETA